MINNNNYNKNQNILMNFIYVNGWIIKINKIYKMKKIYKIKKTKKIYHKHKKQKKYLK